MLRKLKECLLIEMKQSPDYYCDDRVVGKAFIIELERYL